MWAKCSKLKNHSGIFWCQETWDVECKKWKIASPLEQKKNVNHRYPMAASWVILFFSRASLLISLRVFGH